MKSSESTSAGIKVAEKPRYSGKGNNPVGAERSEKQLAHAKGFGGKLDPAIQQRNRLGKAFISRMRADFQKHGIATIEKVRKEKPEVYLNLVSRLVPQQMEVNVSHSFTDVLLEAARRYEGHSREKEEVIIASTEYEKIEE